MSRKVATSATNTESVQQARKNLTRFLKQLETIPYEELERSARVIKAEAIAQTPYKTGKLERSVYVRVTRDKRRVGLVAGASALSPGGFNYAGIQHENTKFNHPIKGKAHFISAPFNEEIERFKQRIRGKVKLKHGK